MRDTRTLFPYSEMTEGDDLLNDTRNPNLTHIDQSGNAQMVDVGWKPDTQREAVARGRVVMQPQTLELIQANAFDKGDVLAVARIAGIMGAKNTSQLIPLCHPLPINKIGIEFDLNSADSAVDITATARTVGKTGVEMEALTAVSIAALTDLRYVQGGRSRNANRVCAARPQVRWSERRRGSGVRMSRRLSHKSIESICAAAGADLPSVTRPLTAPIYQNSVFEIDSLEQVDDIYEGRQDGFIYSRDANPNVAILERVVADLEDADDSVAFASGLGAIAVTLLSMVQSGDTIVAGSELYGGTNVMLRQYMPRLGIESQFVDMTDLDQVEHALKHAPYRDTGSSPRLILIESITNPLLRFADIEAICRLAAERGTRVVVDNTLATPLLLRPLELGADVTLHSATKSLGGHSDVTGGVAAARADVAMEIKGANRIWGSTLDPFAAWLIVRGIRTLPMRVERACENAMQVPHSCPTTRESQRYTIRACPTILSMNWQRRSSTAGSGTWSPTT